MTANLFSLETTEYIKNIRAALNAADYEEARSSIILLGTDAYGLITGVLALDEDALLTGQTTPVARATGCARLLVELTDLEHSHRIHVSEALTACTAAITMLTNRIVDDLVEYSGAETLGPLIEETASLDRMGEHAGEHTALTLAGHHLHTAAVNKQIEIESRQL